MKILSFISVLLSIAFLINVVFAGDDDDSETTLTAKDNITAADNNTGFTSSDNAIEKDETASEAEGNEEIETSSLSRGKFYILPTKTYTHTCHQKRQKKNMILD